ncbi:hypothetical protein T4A_2836 [Trichinella pseudospiralis]|uniref:Uncharacterized protein n=1 Tax=Trichinella pseudospiralis TaxID=6337 RepID=A0A0V1E797_TRIPS|nr:hypothetical protein T4A_2836 [Trichinella pseudospiralis]KRZ30997.1 hypothetical protein T4C_10732 [Trichinella pseudospiralis]
MQELIHQYVFLFGGPFSLSHRPCTGKCGRQQHSFVVKPYDNAHTVCLVCHLCERASAFSLKSGIIFKGSISQPILSYGLTAPYSAFFELNLEIQKAEIVVKIYLIGFMCGE